MHRESTSDSSVQYIELMNLTIFASFSLSLNVFFFFFFKSECFQDEKLKKKQGGSEWEEKRMGWGGEAWRHLRLICTLLGALQAPAVLEPLL